jgi:thymidylate synthase (FAD)
MSNIEQKTEEINIEELTDEDIVRSMNRHQYQLYLDLVLKHDRLEKMSTDKDLMHIDSGPLKIPLYDDKGSAELVDMMPRIVEKGRFADIAVVKSARISYGDILKSINADNNLIRFLWTNKHTTPFESVVFSVRVRAPIFVARQVFRHRLFSYNEISYRYQQPKDEFYYPEVRFQDDANRQMSKDAADLTTEEKSMSKSTWRKSQPSNYSYNNWGGEPLRGQPTIHDNYKNLVDEYGVAREVARTILPVSLMTEWIMTGNARTWLHFLKLRSAKDAQKEIRDLADAISKVIEPRIPTTFATFIDCDVNNLDLPGSTINAIAEFNSRVSKDDLVEPEIIKVILDKHGIKGKRKIDEFIAILRSLNINTPLDWQIGELY